MIIPPKAYGLIAAFILLFIGLVAGLGSRNQPSVKTDLPRLAPFPYLNPESDRPLVNARQAVLIDRDSFYILYEKDAYTPVPIASVTKLATALVVLEKYKPDDVVTVAREATLVPGTKIGLKTGEQITTLNLLKAILIHSGNDAAYALAYHGGSLDEFVFLMNEKAKTVGLKNTKLADPAGLDDAGFSTAFDLGILVARTFREDTVKNIVGTVKETITSTDGTIKHDLENSNRLVKEEMYFEGIIGGKTGFTPLAGHNLVAAAERDGHMLISVIINTYEDTKEASARENGKLLSWGFESHTWK
jgi:D-alanyl-D-alanine carboxypeptidase (penicillin-binding protein 5/6)